MSDECSSDLSAIGVGIAGVEWRTRFHRGHLMSGKTGRTRWMATSRYWRRLAFCGARWTAMAGSTPILPPRIALAFGNRSNFSAGCAGCAARSEEHTYELQSLMRLSYAV